MRRSSLVAATCLGLIASLVACARSQQYPGSAALTASVPSAVAEHDRRIVSLAPSLTEIAYALGCGPKLVADTTYDDFPASARTLPHVADLVSVDLERLSALRPNIVIALHDQERQAAPIQSRLHVKVVYLPNRRLDDLFADISGVGGACGAETMARKLSHTLRARITDVSAKASRSRKHPTVLFLLDLPGFTVGAGSFIDDLIRLAGGINVAGGIGQPYPNVSSEALLAMNPRVIIVAREVRFGADVQKREPWRSISAVRDRRVVRPPSDDIVERNGPRIVEGLRWLAAAIHK